MVVAAGRTLCNNLTVDYVGPFRHGQQLPILRGVWQILYRLSIVADWGATIYK